MKKLLILFSIFILLIISFTGGARYSQYGASQGLINTGERKILHYVDPMNPTNLSSEPGIAPCGMPMEPVYEDEDVLGNSGITSSTAPGTVQVTIKKQQITGVQIDTVTMLSQSAEIRAMGRIVPDENKVYALVAATDGWMGGIHDSTTGSLVSKDQLMGRIRIYDYDFFTWQQRYLTELGNAGRRRVFLSPLSGASDQLKKVISAQQSTGSLVPDIGAPIMLPSNSSMKMTAGESPHTMKEQPSPIAPLPHSMGTHLGIPPGATQYQKMPSEPLISSPSPIDIQLDQDQKRETSALPDAFRYPAFGEENVPKLPSVQSSKMVTGATPGGHQNIRNKFQTKMPSTANVQEHIHPSQPSLTPDNTSSPEKLPSHAETTMPMTAPSHSGSTTSRAQHIKDMTTGKSGGLFFTSEDDILYASKARQELLDLGVVKSQLRQLAETGVYLTYIEFRSPVNGLVLSRNVSTRQRIERGTECFRIADLSRVWVETDIYDIEAKYILPGMKARVSMPGMEESFIASVTEILPVYDAVGRSLKVRLEMDNPENTFRPDMFVDVVFLIDLPESITVPLGAVINSGKRKTVYVVTGEGIFEPRAVTTGWQFENRIEITGGLNVEERVVISGNFLIDSESRMKLAATRLMDDKTENITETQLQKNSEAQPATYEKRDKTSSAKVKDPVCGMNIDPAIAIKAGLTIEIGEEVHYFCSTECAEEFHRHGPKPYEDAPPVPEPPANQTEHDQEQEQMNMMLNIPQSGHDQIVADPVCGMSIDKNTAISAGLTIDNQDETHYFCSVECKDRFDANLQSDMETQQQTDTHDHMEHMQ